MRSFRERRPWIVGLVSLILLTVAVSFAFSINKFQGLRGVYTVSAQLEDAAGLQAGNEVRVAGVKVGRVTDVELTDEAALIEMEISRDVQLPAASRLEVKLKTILGQKFIDLQLPRAFVASRGEDGAVGGFLAEGDVIPLEQTRVPFDIYQAATKGTAVLEEIDKKAVRQMLKVLAKTVGTSGGDLRRALVSLNDVGKVLSAKSADISRLLRNTDKVSGVLASSDSDIDGLLVRSADVLGVLAERRETISSLLAATNHLTANLGTLIEVARGSINLGVADLNTILITAEGELDVIGKSLDELGISQKMFAQPLRFGKFIEGHVCALTTEDTCVPDGSPEVPGLPLQGTQPSPTPAAGAARP